MPSDQIHSRDISFHINDLDPTGTKGNLIYVELLEVTRMLVDIARENAQEIGARYGVEIRVLEIND